MSTSTGCGGVVKKVQKMNLQEMCTRDDVSSHGVF